MSIAALFLAALLSLQVVSSTTNLHLSLHREYGRALFTECRMDIRILEGRGNVSLECLWNVEPRQILKQEQSLTPLEMTEFLSLVEQSDLYGGDYAGIDTTAVDGHFETLKVWTTSGRIAIVVTSGNPTFSGATARGRLLEKLRAKEKELIARAQNSK